MLLVLNKFGKWSQKGSPAQTELYVNLKTTKLFISHIYFEYLEIDIPR